MANGEINWNCPCLGNMASGPCGVDFREAFSCFHYSKADPKGSDCYEPFSKMQQCMVSYPELYPMNNDDDDENELDKALSELSTHDAEKNIEVPKNEADQIDVVQKSESSSEQS